jgi:hypothetical protein
LIPFFYIYNNMLSNIVSNILTRYNQFYLWVRNRYPNIYIVFISILVSIWFQGMFRILEKTFPNKFNINICMMLIPLILLYFGDGRLEEIYRFEGIHKRIGALQYVDNHSAI